MKNNTTNNGDDYKMNKTDLTNDIEEDNEYNDMSISEDSDPMSIEINEGRWISFIPGLTLTSATILFAAIGMSIGLIIALTGDQETEIIINGTRMIYHNISLLEAQETNLSLPNIDEMKLIDGEQYIIWTEIENVTNTTFIPTDKLSDTWSNIIAFPGQLWINALKLLVLPLIIIMMIILPSRVDEIGNIGKKAIPLYIFTSLSASILGTIIAYSVKPGSIANNGNVDNIGNDIEAPEDEKTITEVILDVFYNAVPDNIIISMMEFKIFGIIVFFLCIGLLLRNKKIVPLNERNIVLKFNKAILRCIMKALVYIIWFSPFGMCSLICLRIAETENLLNLLISLGFYLLCIVTGCFCHLFIFYPVLMAISVRGNAYKFFTKFYQAPLLAFATSSSAATLPRSLQMAENAGIRAKIYQFILPLGSAINMDGSAIGYPIQIALIAQLNGITLDIGTIFVFQI